MLINGSGLDASSGNAVAVSLSLYRGAAEPK